MPRKYNYDVKPARRGNQALSSVMMLDPLTGTRSVIATCVGVGDANLIAKLLNDHDRDTHLTPAELDQWRFEGDPPNNGASACPMCYSIYLDGGQARHCCPERRGDYEPQLEDASSQRLGLCECGERMNDDGLCEAYHDDSVGAGL
jgi:hypothetical protein